MNVYFTILAAEKIAGIVLIVAYILFWIIVIYINSKIKTQKGTKKMTYYMMNESEAKNVLILINRELAQLERQDDFMSKHDYEVLSKIKKNLISAFPTI